MRKLKIVGFFALVLLLVVEVLVFAPESVNLPRRVRSSSPQATRDVPEQSLEGVHYTEAQSNGRDWELWAKKASGSRDKGDWVLEKVKVHVFGKDNISYTVSGDKGTILLNQKDLEITGHVVTRSSNGYVFTTDHITYQSETRTLHGPGKVHMRSEFTENSKMLDLTGRDMLANLNDEHITISHNVHARKGVSPTKTVSIKSERAVFSARNASASFYEDVVVEMGDARITGPKAEFIFDPKTNQMQSLAVDGGIRLSDLDRWATAQRIDMLFKEDKFILSGSPRVVQNSDELFGDQIIYSNGGKDIYVNDVKARFEDEVKDKVMK